MDFDELYEQEFRKTYQYIRYMVSNAQVAEDLTQDTYMRIYKTDLTKVTHFLDLYEASRPESCLRLLPEESIN